MLGFRGSRGRTRGHVPIAALLALLLGAGAIAPVKADSSHMSAAEMLNAQQLQALSAAPAPRSLTATLEPGQADEAAPAAWRLMSGMLVGQQLASWGQAAGWRVIWNYNQDWLVPSAAVFQGDFTSAASQVLDYLAAEGAPVHGVFYQGNHTLVITGGSQ